MNRRTSLFSIPIKAFTVMLFFTGFTLTTTAQPNRQTDEASLPGHRSALNIRSAMYPRILPGNCVEFKVKAPEAEKVQIDLGRKYDMERSETGEWSCITDPLTYGFHYYFLIVDGVAVADPASESFYGCGMMTSGIEIPYLDGIDVFYLKDVPHGEIRMKRYFSTTANDWRRMFIYTPPCYEKSNKTYPVLYLLHGGGEDERGWSQQGRTDIILDNLIADNQAVPMVIVMTDGNSRDFTSELLHDCIPFVEKNSGLKPIAITEH